VTQRMLDAHLADVDWRLRALCINVNSPVREVFDFEKDQILWDK
jgi:hypothetical protein